MLKSPQEVIVHVHLECTTLQCMSFRLLHRLNFAVRGIEKSEVCVSSSGSYDTSILSLLDAQHCTHLECMCSHLRIKLIA